MISDLWQELDALKSEERNDTHVDTYTYTIFRVKVEHVWDRKTAGNH